MEVFSLQEMSNTEDEMKKANGAHRKTTGCVPGEILSWDEVLPVPKLSLKLSFVVVVACAVLCFIASHDGDFVFDDAEAVVNNKDVLPESPISDLFKHDFWGNKLASNTSHKSFRPLTVLTFRLNYLLAGGLHPRLFHVTNILLHGLSSALVLIVCSIILSNSVCHTAPRATLVCSLLFSTHPIHTESVAGVVGRADLLCAVCFLLSFLCYIKALNTDTDCHGRPITFSKVYLVLSLSLCAVSVFCKEQGITIIGICCVYDFVVRCKVNPAKLINCWSNGYPVGSNGTKNSQPADHHSWFTSLLLRHLLLTITGLALLSVRWWVMGSSPPTFQVVDNPHSFVNSSFLRIINYHYLYSINSWLLVNPWWLCFDWSMGCVPVIQSYLDPRVMAAVAFWFVMGSVIYMAIKSLDCHLGRVLALSVALVIIPFLPGANLFFRVGFVIAERVLYLSSIGYCLLVTLGVAQLCRISWCRNVVRVSLYFVLTVFIVRSIVRSREWRTELSLFTSGARVCPGNAKVHYNIAKISADMGDTEKAVELYRLAIRLNPDYDQAMNNLANILKEQDNLLEAEQLLERAVQISPVFAAAWMNLGIVQSGLKKTDLAEQSYRMAITHRNNYPDSYYNLGNLYLSLNRNDAALNAWMKATQLKPTHHLSWNNMLILLDTLGNVSLAESIATEAIKHLPKDASIRYNIANCYGKAGMFERSEENFLEAIRLDPGNAAFYSNLGVLYHRWGKYKEAESAYKTSLNLDPHLQSTHSSMLY